MSRRFLVRSSGLALALATALTAGAAAAQEGEPGDEPSDAERALARDEYRRGVTAAEDGRWEAAREAFDRAHGLVGLPEILYNLAGAQAQTGRLVEAAESYRRFLREADTGQAAALRSDAEQFLGEVVDRIPSVVIEVENWNEGDVLEVGGEEVAAAVLGRPLPRNPGPHAIVVRRNGEELGRRQVILQEGETREVSLTVRPPTPREVAMAAGGTEGSSDPDPLGGNGDGGEPDGGGLLSSPWFWVVTGVLIVGGAGAYLLLTQPEAEQPYEGDVPSVTL